MDLRFVGNLLWVLFGGGILAILWAVVGFLSCCTLIGIPVGIQCFKFASLVLWPFGRDIVFSNHTGSFLLNIIWILVFGWELALASFALGVLWCITIVGIPFGLQLFKFAKIALLPFGTQIVVCCQ